MSDQSLIVSQGVDAAFAELRSLVVDWRSAGRVTTTAGLKPALKDRMPGFSEADYGFTTFRDFTLAAQDADYVRISRLHNGHNLLHLPEESIDELGAMVAHATSGSAESPLSTMVPHSRLKSEVWGAFVDWNTDYVRFWDRRSRKAFMYPVAEDGSLRIESEPERFVRVPPVTFGQQQLWMREWANSLSEPSRAAVIESLADDAPSGEFRRTLGRWGLSDRWRLTLQQKVWEAVGQWVAQENVPLGDITDRRKVAASASASGAVAPGVSEVVPSRPDAKEANVTGGHHEVAATSDQSELHRLRQLVHRAVDRMSLAELAALPLRAEHLLDR